MIILSLILFPLELSPLYDFSEESIPTEIMLTVINSITSQAITPAEKALDKFTRHDLKNMDTWNNWEAGERKQLN